MPIYKFATAVNVGTLLNRDVMMINPVINATAGPPNLDVLAQDWANAMKDFLTPVGAPRITVKVYDVQKHPHGPPLATKTANTLTALPVRQPRELAVCLSFYSEFNAKRRRGRLYIPLNWIEPSGGATARPSAPHRTLVGTLATQLQDLGGLAEDWSIWSKVDNTARAVTDWWVDDEWDIQRRRGDRPTTRTTGTTSEMTP